VTLAYIHGQVRISSEFGVLIAIMAIWSEEEIMPISLKTANTAHEKNEVYKLRYRVFVEEERRFDSSSERIFDFYDTLEENINFIAIEGGEVVGSLRATVENRIGIPALEHYDFRPLMDRTPGKFAGIGWLCVSKRFRTHRGLLPALIKVMVREIKKRGGKHLIAPLHPPLLPLVKRFGAKQIDEEFFSEELKVMMVPIHINFDDLPPGLREFSQDPAQILFEDSTERRIYRQGERIIEKGKEGTEAFLIMRGSVEVLLNPKSLKNKKTFCDDIDRIEANPLLGQGQVFGDLAVIDEGTRTATVVCHSKEVDVMAWSKDQIYQQLNNDPEKILQLCKILASRLRTEVLGYQKVQAHEALVATIAIEASREAEETVDLKWLAQQCGFRLKELTELIAIWSKKKIAHLEDEQTIRILKVDKLKKKAIWK